MTVSAPTAYKAKQFNLAGLTGISDKTLEMHLKLYEGYVASTNKLSDQLTELAANGQAASTNPAYAEITRGLGFEYNGMVLHEHYFANLKRQASAQPSKELADMLDATFGGVDSFLTDFKAIGGMRGVGWAILYQDPATGRLSNHWITLHQDGHPAGFKPLLVMDVWEHAFLLDYPPSERGKYIEAFFSNVDWDVVGQRLETAGSAVTTTDTDEGLDGRAGMPRTVAEPMSEGDQLEQRAQ